MRGFISWSGVNGRPVVSLEPEHLLYNLSGGYRIGWTKSGSVVPQCAPRRVHDRTWRNGLRVKRMGPMGRAALELELLVRAGVRQPKERVIKSA
jgi:hypothetical protein